MSLLLYDFSSILKVTFLILCNPSELISLDGVVGTSVSLVIGSGHKVK